MAKLYCIRHSLVQHSHICTPVVRHQRYQVQPALANLKLCRTLDEQCGCICSAMDEHIKLDSAMESRSRGQLVQL